MAVEIFVGMYLFRILSIGPVGFVLAFIVSVLQSIVDLFPTPSKPFTNSSGYGSRWHQHPVVPGLLPLRYFLFRRTACCSASLSADGRQYRLP
jgi:hypothetical protein